MEIRIYDVQTDAGLVGIVSLVSSETNFTKGIPLEATLGTVPAGTEHILPDNFSPNPIFVQFLHYVIARHAPMSTVLREEAQRQRNGFVYLIDFRADDSRQAVPPEDILGAFEIEEGTPTSYRSNPNHRLLTERGLFVLDSWLESKLLEEISALR